MTVGRPDVRTVTVTGAGSAAAEADVVRLHVAAHAVRATASDAVAATDDCVRRVRDALAGTPVGGTVADSVDLSLTTDETWEVDPRTGRNTQRRNGFRAGHGLLVRVGSRDALGSVLTAVLEAGGDDLAVQHVEFAVADTTALRDRAREQAWQDARHRAVAHAAEVGGDLGRVLEVTEDLPAGPRPMGTVRAMSELGSTLEPGSVEVAVAVTVRWELS